MRRRAANWFNSLQTMLRLQLPAWLVFAIATLVEHPASLILLLVGNAITMTAVCRALGFDLDGTYLRGLARRGLAYFVALSAYTVFVTLVVMYDRERRVQVDREELADARRVEPEIVVRARQADRQQHARERRQALERCGNARTGIGFAGEIEREAAHRRTVSDAQVRTDGVDVAQVGGDQQQGVAAPREFVRERTAEPARGADDECGHNASLRASSDVCRR